MEGIRVRGSGVEWRGGQWMQWPLRGWQRQLEANANKFHALEDFSIKKHFLYKFYSFNFSLLELTAVHVTSNIGMIYVDVLHPKTKSARGTTKTSKKLLLQISTSIWHVNPPYPCFKPANAPLCSNQSLQCLADRTTGFKVKKCQQQNKQLSKFSNVSWV